MSMLAIPFPALPKDVMVDIRVIFERLRSDSAKRKCLYVPRGRSAWLCAMVCVVFVEKVDEAGSEEKAASSEAKR